MPEIQPRQRPNRGFFPISTIRAEDGTSDENWLKIMPTGTWIYHHFGTEGNYRITPDDIRSIVEHFDAGLPGHQIAVDERHGHGRAPGWIERLRADDDGLWAIIDWTKLGDELIEDRQYRYFSPEWHGDHNPYVHARTGESTPWVLVGLGLTNTPYFEGDLPVAASQDGSISIAGAQSYRAPWDQTENEIRHRLRSPGDFREGTFRRKNLQPSAVRKVKVSFRISDAMARGVTMVLGKLKNGGDSMVLQSLRWVRKTDEQDGWTLAQAREWFRESSFSKQEAAMPDSAQPDNRPEQGTQSDPARTADDHETIAALTAERDQLATEKAELEAKLAAQEAATDASKSQAGDLVKRVGDLEDKDARREIRDRLTAMRFGEQGDRAIPPAHISKLVDSVMAMPADKRDGSLTTIEQTVGAGLVPIGEIGSAKGADLAGAVSAAQSEMNHQLGISDEDFLKHNVPQ